MHVSLSALLPGEHLSVSRCAAPGAWAPLYHRALCVLSALGCAAVATTPHVSHEIPTD